MTQSNRHLAAALGALAAGTAGLCLAASWGQPEATTNQPAEPATKTPAVHPEADRLLKAASATLAGAEQLSFKVEAWSDEVVGKHKISTTRSMAVQMHRPNRLQVEVRSPKRSRGFWYDGKTVTVLDRVANLYGTIDAPSSIDLLVDFLQDQYGITMPLDDLILSDPYASAKPNVRSGAYFGKVTILGVPCEHLGFSTDAVDWQLWVEEGEQHLPRKMVITYKQEETSPQFTAIFTEWDLGTSIPDGVFTFAPPPDVGKMDIKRREATAAADTE